MTTSMGHMRPWIIFGVSNPVIEALYGLTGLPLWMLIK